MKKTFKAWQASTALLSLLLAAHPAVVARAAAADAAGLRPVRLAVIEAPSGLTNSVDRSARANLLDLLTARLSATDGFELVERSDLDAIFRELSLSAANLSHPDSAVQVGRMVKADQFLLLSYPAAMTNAVLGKILDASTGIIRDVQLVPMKPVDVAKAAEALVTFAVASRNPAAGLGPRLWMGFGGFDDLGLYRRYRDFGDRLRTALTLKYAGTRVSMVERSQMTPLMEELRLSQDGFVEVRTNRTPAQPAFVLVDGLYQAFRDEQSKINLVLRMEWVGGRRSIVAIKELPGAPLEVKVVEAIDQFLAESPVVTATNSPTRQAEVKAQLARGRELAGIRSTFFVPLEGVSAWSVYPRDRVPRVRDAISTFESALFLDPENLEAKFGLAGCLVDPLIDQVERARDYWLEIAAASTNAQAVSAARSALAFSYIERDDLQAFDLISSLRNATTNVEQRAALNGRLSMIRSRLGAQGQLTPQDILGFATDAWRTECRLAELRLSSGLGLDVYRTFTLRMSDYYHAFKGTNSTRERQEYIGTVVSNLVNEFPRFEPYLVASYARDGNVSPSWKAWHERTLADCAEHPERIVAPTNYYSDCLNADLQSFIGRKDYELADRVARMFEKNGRDYIEVRQSKDDLDFLLGHLHFKLNRFKEAVAAFERIGSRQVWSGELDDVWGKRNFISGVRAAEICRQRAAVAANPAGPARRQSIKPVQVLPGAEMTFAIDGGQIWLADRVGFYRYKIQSGELKPVPLRVNLRVRQILAHRNKVWFATAGGLYAVDPNDGSVLTNSVDDGLIMQSVTALAADGDRLWVGFGESLPISSRGGLGYLNLKENRFVGLMSDLPATGAKPNPGSQSEGAQRRYVTGLAKSSAGLLWITSTSRLLQYDGPGEISWQAAIPHLGGAMPAGIVANKEYVVIPCYEPNSWSSLHTNFGGVFIYDVQKKAHRRLTSNDGLPNNKLYSAVLDGSKVWLGGEGFVALIDLPLARVETVQPLSSALSVRSMAVDGNDLWFSSGPGLYRLPRRGDVESNNSDPGPPAPVPAGPEITDIQSARELFQKREQIYRTYGTRDTPEYREMTARYHAFIRRAAKDLPLLESPSRTSTNHFMERLMNKEGRGYDGFRFRSTLAEPADFGWIFAYESPSSFQQWSILPVEDTPMAGFTDWNTPKIAYTNAPWTGLNGQFVVLLQFLNNGQLAHGKDYIIWLDFKDDRPTRFFMAFDLFPASAGHRSRSVLEGAFGLGGTPIPGRF